MRFLHGHGGRRYWPRADGHRQCVICGEWKPPADFHRAAKTPDGLAYRCKRCNVEVSRQFRDRNPDYYQHANHRIQIRFKFGVTEEWYRATEAAQGGLCAICHRPERRRRPSGQPSQLAVDHDHASGQVRALLCHHCNSALGALDDNPELLEAAAAYLRAWSIGPGV